MGELGLWLLIVVGWLWFRRCLSGDRIRPNSTNNLPPDGYGTYNPRRGMVLDTGLFKSQARRECHRLNLKGL